MYIYSYYLFLSFSVKQGFQLKTKLLSIRIQAS